MTDTIPATDDYVWCDTCRHNLSPKPVSKGTQCYSCKDMNLYSRDTKLVLLCMEKYLTAINRQVEDLKDELANIEKGYVGWKWAEENNVEGADDE